jgi:hypothetical protein
MEVLRQTSIKGYNYVHAIDKSTWAHPYLKGSRHGQNTSNIIESVNASFVSERKQSCIELLDGIWKRTMNTCYERRQESFRYTPCQTLTHYGTRLLKVSLNYAQQ